mmetsp:Transcript_57831/g.102738  ORF Transcript_57831/g.102738 Transcript_57831/m.102738 type:complete len:502 (-) Transcript_57831:66-1571(-)
MFLSKDALDDGGSQLPRPPPPPGVGGPGSLPARPGSAAGRPGTAASQRPGVEDGAEDDSATPSSAASLRQKMLQQRQRALQKQRTGPLVSGSMVMANQGMPTGGPTASQSPTASTMGSRPGTAASSMMTSTTPSELEALKSPTHGSTGGTDFTAEGEGSLLQSVMSSMAVADGESAEGMVAPNPMSADEIKAEESRRRQSLAAQLDEKGISPVFDPGPSSGSGSTGPPQKSTFDVSTIPPDGMKQFLLQPTPKTVGMLECRIIREKGGLSKLYPKYILETDSGVFLMAAKKLKNQKTSKYIITMSKTDDTGKDNDAMLGKLRSNFLGLEFVAYGEGLNPKKIDSSMSQVHALQLARQELLAVQYSSSLWGTKPRGPRKMGTVIPKVQSSGERLICRTLNPDQDGLIAMQKANNTNLIHQFHNKPPKWNEQVGAFVLNFNKRVTQASVKNFQLTTSEDPDTVFLQFGRVGKDVFNMDFRFPFSPYQAFAICLSSFDYKLCCE